MTRIIDLSRDRKHSTRSGWAGHAAILCLAATLAIAPARQHLVAQSPADAEPEQVGPTQPWDFSPYRVLIWVVSEDPRISASTLEEPLRDYLDIDFHAVWRTEITDAPVSIAAATRRGIGSLTYDLISASDPVVAVKRDHSEAVRIRAAANVGALIEKVSATASRIEDIKRRGAAIGNDTVDGIVPRLVAVDGDEVAVRDLWQTKETAAILIPRGMAMTLKDPDAKLITPPIGGLVGQAVESYDKIFIVHVDSLTVPHQVSVVEMETLMRHFGPVANESANSHSGIIGAVGRGLTRAFAPVVRIENAGQRNAFGLLRAGGLVLDEESPAFVGVDDVLEPMTRKNDRNGRPIFIGSIDWAYLYVTKATGSKLEMDYHAGRPGGLQGRKNKRTFRTALKVRPFGEQTLIRLHAKGDADFPLIGYEIYQKELTSKSMTFVGRTDWNGRLWVKKTEDPLRLFYVKNGGSVLARLPTVPGLKAKEVADISGDDMRLQAEAYVRGVQNSIIDLVAVRELFKARIRLRLTKGGEDNVKRAQELLDTLETMAGNQDIAKEMEDQRTVFIDAVKKNANQRKKIDDMFTTTLDLLAKHINPRLVQELGADVREARKNGNKLPASRQEED